MSDSSIPHSVVESPRAEPPQENAPKEISERAKAVALMVFGVGLFAITATVITVLRSGREMSDALIAAGTVVSAIAAGFIAWFTIKLTAATDRLSKLGKRQEEITYEQLRAMRRQADQMELEFIATHRPKLIVRSVDLRNAHMAGDSPNHLKMVFTCHYLIVNTGPTSATIVQATSTRSMVPNPRGWTPDDPVYTSDGDGVVGRELKSGESCVGTCDNGSELIGSVAARLPFPIYFLGYVVYEDSVGVRRRTGFFRRYEPKERNLVREKNRDYEYAD
jgi:hypothetical protein